MENVMTQGFTELNENEIVDIEGGKDWVGVVKGTGTVLYGVGNFYYHVFTGSAGQMKNDLKTALNGASQIIKAWNC